MSSVKSNSYYDVSGGSNAQLYGVASPPNSMGFRNRIINGDMRFDQRNGGASVTPGNTNYTLDRWQSLAFQPSKYSVQRNANSVTPPTGFTNYLGVTSLSAYSVLTGDYFAQRQIIEGNNIADLAWGSASAKAVTLTFRVRSSLTGTFGGSIRNEAGNRSYPFTYTISAANTWETKVVNITGDTTGTWATDNTGGIHVNFGLGVGATFSGTAGAWAAANYVSATGATSVVGTNAATWYVTGVQLEAGTFTSATEFERRDYGRELMMCQRYYWPCQSTSGNGTIGFGYAPSGTIGRFLIPSPVTMRDTPTFASSTNNVTIYPGAVAVAFSSGSTNTSGQGIAWDVTTAGLTTGAITLVATPASGPSFSAEL